MTPTTTQTAATLTRVATVKKLLRHGPLPLPEIKLIMGGDTMVLDAEIRAATAAGELTYRNAANGGPRRVMLPMGRGRGCSG